MTLVESRGARVFLASFLVLFLEVALIRWMPAYIRLLAYFSNFILLASFLGIGVGCLLAPSRRRLFLWFPLLQALVIAAVYYFRLEVAISASGSIYFTSGTVQPQVVVESTMLLPLIFVAVAALFATMAQPVKGLVNTVAAAVIGVVLAHLYTALMPIVSGSLASGPPSYDLEVWLANALLSVTFPFLIYYAVFFSYWPLTKPTPPAVAAKI